MKCSRVVRILPSFCSPLLVFNEVNALAVQKKSSEVCALTSESCLLASWMSVAANVNCTGLKMFTASDAGQQFVC